MEENLEQIVGIKIAESTIGGINGPVMFFVTLSGGEDVPLFPFDESAITFEPSSFIGMNIQEAYEFKRMQDLIWFQQIFI